MPREMPSVLTQKKRVYFSISTYERERERENNVQLHLTINFIKPCIFVSKVQFRMRNQNSKDQFQFIKVTTNTISFLSVYQNKQNLNY